MAKFIRCKHCGSILKATPILSSRKKSNSSVSNEIIAVLNTLFNDKGSDNNQEFIETIKTNTNYSIHLDTSCNAEQKGNKVLAEIILDCEFARNLDEDEIFEEYCLETLGLDEDEIDYDDENLYNDAVENWKSGNIRRIYNDSAEEIHQFIVDCLNEYGIEANVQITQKENDYMTFIYKTVITTN